MYNIYKTNLYDIVNYNDNTLYIIIKYNVEIINAFLHFKQCFIIIIRIYSWNSQRLTIYIVYSIKYNIVARIIHYNIIPINA